MTTATATDTGIRFLAAGSGIEEMTGWLSEDHGTLAVDTETTGLDVDADGFAVRQVCIGASDGTAWVLDGADRDLARAALTAAVRSGKPLWAHNATYDWNVIRAVYGMRLNGLRCSLAFTRTFDPGLIETGGGSLKVLRPATQAALDQLAAHWSRIGGTPVSADDGHSWLADAVVGLASDDPVLLRYVATDAIECARLVDQWRRDVPDRDERRCGAREVKVEDLWRIPSSRGYVVDTAMLDQELAKLDDTRAEVVARWGVDLTGTSNAVRAWVAERGIEITDRYGKPTLSWKAFPFAEVPESAQEDWREFVAAREVGRNANKLNEIDGALRSDRVYPSIRGLGAKTGRMAMSRPALQNLPEKLRPLLLADPGMVLVGCDLDRVEPRVIAALTQDEALVEAVQQDVYTELALSIYGAEAEGNPRLRKIAKTAFLAIAYGEGLHSLAFNLGVPVSEAKQVLAGIRRAYPRMAQWMTRVKRDAEHGRDLHTAYGRLLPRTPEKPYRAVNWLIQGTAADLFKIITVEVAEVMGRHALWMPMHDELVLQVTPDRAEEACDVLRQAMTTELDGVPITGTPVVLGERWGKA